MCAQRGLRPCVLCEREIGARGGLCAHHGAARSTRSVFPGSRVVGVSQRPSCPGWDAGTCRNGAQALAAGRCGAQGLQRSGLARKLRR